MLSGHVQLLNYECNDVDICLADMMGVPFAERFVTFVSERKQVPIHKVTKIESNPDQSKHLETARTTLFGIDLDFVNLRSEEYSEHSRIPTEVVCWPTHLLFHQLIASVEVWNTTPGCLTEGHHDQHALLQCSHARGRGLHRQGKRFGLLSIYCANRLKLLAGSR